MQDLESYRKSVVRRYRRAFSKGVGSIMSIPGNYFPAPDLSRPEVRDMEAMRNDWEAVGSYLWHAIDNSKSTYHGRTFRK